MADLLAEYVDAKADELARAVAAIGDPVVVFEATWDVDLDLFLVFLFVSPEQPDFDSPRWWQQHLAHRCSGCRRLQLPHSDRRRPADLCERCWLEAERRARQQRSAQAGADARPAQELSSGGDEARRPPTHD